MEPIISTTEQPKITLELIQQYTQAIKLPESFLTTFVDHYNNQHTYLCCHTVTTRLYGDNHTKQHRDQLMRSIGKLNSDLYQTFENEECNCQASSEGARQASKFKSTTSFRQKHVYVSYNTFKKLAAKLNETLYDYYIQLEGIVFNIMNNQLYTVQTELTTIQQQLTTYKQKEAAINQQKCLLYTFMHNNDYIYIGQCKNKRDTHARVKKHFKDAQALKHLGISRIAAYLHANNQYEPHSGPIQVHTAEYNRSEIDHVEKQFIQQYQPLCNTIFKLKQNLGDLDEPLEE